MPLAWDVKVGTLEIVEPAVPAEQRMLADYQKVPASICMWSGPTPPGGVVTEVVLAGTGAPTADLKGKLVLGTRSSKRALAAAGALGIISDNTENRDLADERGWVNSFGDNGWSFTKGNAPLVCFSITPRGSQVLRGLLAKGPVKVRANVDSRHYTGVYPYVTGVIRGADGPNAEEVLSLGHLFEQGAHDNATGVASIIGAAETLNRLIKAGKLPRPKRSIRVLGMGECYGTNYYLEHNQDRVKRTIAAMCIDSPAGLQHLAGTEHTWILNPHSAVRRQGHLRHGADAERLRLADLYRLPSELRRQRGGAAARRRRDPARQDGDDRIRQPASRPDLAPAKPRCIRRAARRAARLRRSPISWCRWRSARRPAAR